MARIFDIVEFFDETGQQMVHRVPEHGSGDFRLGSQLIVLQLCSAPCQPCCRFRLCTVC